MELSDKGLSFIQSWEGFSHEPYICSGGHSTIGYGHLIQEHEKDYLKHVTRKTASEILAKDVKWAEQTINDEPHSNALSQHEFDALVSFVFNMGASAFRSSAFYRKLMAYMDYKFEAFHGDIPVAFLTTREEATELRRDALWEMIDFIHASGKPLKGLSKRRAAESWMFLTGVYKNNS